MPARFAAVALAALVFAAPASAGPVKSGVYGTPYGSKLTLNVTVSPSGKKLDNFFLDLPTACHIGKYRPHYPTTFAPTPDMVVKRGGRFGYTEIIRGPRPGAVAKWHVSGRFSADGRSVTATGRYWLKRPDGGCDTKTHTVKAPLNNLSRSGPFTGTYSGKTETGEPITFNVQRDRITDVRSRATLKCDDGTSVVRDVQIAEVKISEDRFEVDDITGRFPDQFQVEGTLTPRERMQPTAEDPDPGFCTAADSFTAKPTRPLDS
jgi:hypothetical protein